jgi:hypothetical protein
MSRFMIIASLVFGLSSVATASEARFAQPPGAVAAEAADRATADPIPAQLRIMPRRVLDRATVRAALAKARATNLAGFRVYQKKGVFPNNTFKPGKLNVWLDEDGNFCAAATIIKMSGMDDLVHKVAEQNNFIRLADVKQGPLMDWILTSGLTQDEIAAIQEPFMPVRRAADARARSTDRRRQQAPQGRERAAAREVQVGRPHDRQAYEEEPRPSRPID